MTDTNETKSWLASRTVWGGVVAVLAAVGGLVGLPIDNEMHGQLTDALLAVAAGVGGVVAIWGRVTASKKIG
jgi:hypothetical protein